MFTEQERQDGIAAMQEYLTDKFVIAGTGSRNYKRTEQVYTLLREELDGSHNKHRDGLVVMSGGAQGWDAEIARTAYRLNIPYVLEIPSPDYGSYYWKEDLDTWNTMLEHAQRVEYVCKGHQYGKANLIRNDRMVELADAFLVYNPTSRGTAHCLTAIKRAKKPYRVLGGK